MSYESKIIDMRLNIQSKEAFVSNMEDKKLA